MKRIDDQPGVRVNHYVRRDQYEWLRRQPNHTVFIRELIDAAMYDPRLVKGAALARLHRSVRELNRMLSDIEEMTDKEPRSQRRPRRR